MPTCNAYLQCLPTMATSNAYQQCLPALPTYYLECLPTMAEMAMQMHIRIYNDTLSLCIWCIWCNGCNAQTNKHIVHRADINKKISICAKKDT